MWVMSRTFLRILFATAIVWTLQGAVFAAKVDVTKKYTAKPAAIAQDKKSEDEKAVKPRMYADSDKKASLVKKAKVKTTADVKKAEVKQTKNAEKLDPKEVGAKKMSMQDYNRYVYRKSHGVKSGVPVTKAGGDSAPKKK